MSPLRHGQDIARLRTVFARRSPWAWLAAGLLAFGCGLNPQPDLPGAPTSGSGTGNVAGNQASAGTLGIDPNGGSDNKGGSGNSAGQASDAGGAAGETPPAGGEGGGGAAGEGGGPAGLGGESGGAGGSPDIP